MSFTIKMLSRVLCTYFAWLITTNFDFPVEPPLLVFLGTHPNTCRVRQYTMFITICLLFSGSWSKTSHLRRLHNNWLWVSIFTMLTWSSHMLPCRVVAPSGEKLQRSPRPKQSIFLQVFHEQHSRIHLLLVRYYLNIYWKYACFLLSKCLKVGKQRHL